MAIYLKDLYLAFSSNAGNSMWFAINRKKIILKEDIKIRIKTASNKPGSQTLKIISLSNASQPLKHLVEKRGLEALLKELKRGSHSYFKGKGIL